MNICHAHTKSNPKARLRSQREWSAARWAGRRQGSPRSEACKMKEVVAAEFRIHQLLFSYGFQAYEAILGKKPRCSVADRLEKDLQVRLLLSWCLYGSETRQPRPHAR